LLPAEELFRNAFFFEGQNIHSPHKRGDFNNIFPPGAVQKVKSELFDSPYNAERGEQKLPGGLGSLINCSFKDTG